MTDKYTVCKILINSKMEFIDIYDRLMSVGFKRSSNSFYNKKCGHTVWDDWIEFHGYKIIKIILFSSPMCKKHLRFSGVKESFDYAKITTIRDIEKMLSD